LRNDKDSTHTLIWKYVYPIGLHGCHKDNVPMGPCGFVPPRVVVAVVVVVEGHPHMVPCGLYGLFCTERSARSLFFVISERISSELDADYCTV
jgi:hypothetical protein